MREGQIQVSAESAARVGRMAAECRVPSMQDADRAERRAAAAGRQREENARRIEAMNEAAGYRTQEGSIPVSPMLRELLERQSAQRQEAAE